MKEDCGKSKRIEITMKNFIFVEGDDECAIIKRLLEILKIPDCQIFSVDGTSHFNDLIKTFNKAPGFYSTLENFAVIRDADDSFENAYKSIRESLRRSNYQVPKKGHGQIFYDKEIEKKIGIMILPDHASSGLIEDLCLNSIQDEADKQIIICVDGYYKCLKDHGIQLKEMRERKARASVFLAAKSKRDLCIGHAINRSYWNFDHEIFTPLNEFLKEMFDAQPPIVESINER